MKEIVINSKTHGSYVVLIDDNDFDWVSKIRWCLAKRNHGLYAVTANAKKNLMHRILLKTKKQVDHKDGNTLNNQRHNLREASIRQNSWNKKTPSNNTSGYKGVYLLKNCPRPIFWAHIKTKNRRISLGCFESKIDAALAYNKAALKYFGEFARLNEV